MQNECECECMTAYAQLKYLNQNFYPKYLTKIYLSKKRIHCQCLSMDWILKKICPNSSQSISFNFQCPPPPSSMLQTSFLTISYTSIHSLVKSLLVSLFLMGPHSRPLISAQETKLSSIQHHCPLNASFILL